MLGILSLEDPTALTIVGLRFEAAGYHDTRIKKGIVHHVVQDSAALSSVESDAVETPPETVLLTPLKLSSPVL